MATQDTIKFGDVVLQISDGAVIPTYSAVCGFTSFSRTFNIQTQSEDLPDCADPNAVSFDAPRKIAVGEQMAFQGYIDPTNSNLLYDLVYDENERMIRLVYNKGIKVGYYEGPAVLTAGAESYDRRQSGKISGTLAFTAKPVWHAT